MPGTGSGKVDFIDTIRAIIEENISNERFGVSELAEALGMSRSNLLRKLKKSTGLSVSRFIRELRLEKAMELLNEGSLTVSEISYQVGFNSLSYFIKCFHEHYGYPPGEVAKGSYNSNESAPDVKPGKKRLFVIIISVAAFLLTVIVLFVVVKPSSLKNRNLEKSIAVLPFKNDSNDSTNIYIINGLMESILNNLQQIEDIRVVSRTSVERYRFAPMIIPEIARELNVKYFVEGSGQKIGDEILLNIQLIEALSDRNLWSGQYRRETSDIFDLQSEVATDIVKQIKAIITPEEKARISRKPTENILAYDYFLKGLDLLNKPEQDQLDKALEYFGMALELDNEFARAYAAVAITYYQIDKNHAEKSYTELINSYADKALLYDPQLAQSLIAKALYYMSEADYKMAITYFEKALEYNPNSDIVYVFLVDLYANYYPDTEKYLEYALKGLRINIAAYDSITISYSFLHISNSFIQSGFVDEAEKYIDKSLEYFPGNIYSAYVKPYIQYSGSRDLEETRELLLGVLEKDTSRLDVLQEVAKIYYYLRDYKESYYYYKKFTDGREAFRLSIYPGEDAKIAFVLSEMGLKEEAELMIEKYKTHADADISVYKHLSLSAYYSFMGETEKAIEELRLFSKEDNYNYWTILFLDIDPLMDNINDHPQYPKIVKDIENRFWKYHKRVRKRLESEGLI